MANYGCSLSCAAEPADTLRPTQAIAPEAIQQMLLMPKDQMLDRSRLAT
jgi:hypothetical protein